MTIFILLIKAINLDIQFSCVGLKTKLIYNMNYIIIPTL